MKILVISWTIPRPDRYSGDLRFFSLLRSLCSAHDVHLCARALYNQLEKIGEAELLRYRGMLEVEGVVDASPNPVPVLESGRFDCILFEFYHSALGLLKEVRFRQPAARVLVDSVDVHFHRLTSRARLSGSNEDRVEAQRVRREELAVYRSADAVIAVSEQDRQVLLESDPDLEVSVIPNFHRVLPLPSDVAEPRNRLVFVGGFGHHPNVDAVGYFCSQVLPVVKQRLPAVSLKVVGSDPTDEVRALESPGIEVAGFVGEIEPVLRDSHISVAPLRYGGGMKGKVGEAMAMGLPVVTTTVGIEGFGLTPGSDVLVGDSPSDFARQILRLVENKDLYQQIREAGWRFVRERLSVEVVSQHALAEFQRLSRIPIKRLPAHVRLPRAVRSALDRHLLWRFNG